MDKRPHNSPQKGSPKKARIIEVKRRNVAPINPQTDKLIFQEIEFDHYIGLPYPGMPGAQRGSLPVMRMFGVTREGNSVCCHIHGFAPYMYVGLPDSFQESECFEFKNKLNDAVIADNRNQRDVIVEAVLMVELVAGKNLMEYQGEGTLKFAKITMALPRMLAAVKRLLETTTVYQPLEHHHYTCFESNVDIETRFMVDTKVLGCCWIELPPTTYKLRSSSSLFPATTRCQIEADVSFSDFIAHPPEGEWASIAKFRFLSFDIECAGRKGYFPQPEFDPIIQISNVLCEHGVDKPVTQNVFTLGTCAPVANAEIRSFATEAAMLSAWAEFLRETDPDILTGYNMSDFDMPYLITRANTLKLKNFDYLGRLLNVRSVVKEVSAQTKFGRRNAKQVNVEGRIPYDMLLVMRKHFKLRSYTLNNVCSEILGEQKEDVHYSIITELQNGDEQTRRRLAVYCLKDSVLPIRLINKVKCFINDVEMSRVTGVPLTSLLTKGEQVKVVAQLLRHAREHGYYMPTHHGSAGSEQFEGATVIEPIRGYYTDPIATLDFSSLYPSIMIAHNLCYTTLLKPNSIQKLNLSAEVITTTPVKCQFVKATVRKGLLPQILEQLLAARKRTKAEMKTTTDPSMLAVLDGRQLAYKISANSVYGFTGAQVGKLPCLEISGSVTAYGRSMIEQTKQEVEQKYCIANGYSQNAQVIYGDTDSVMVNFRVKTLEESMELGREAAEAISTKFIKPIKLEFEKVYFPYLLINKKRYAGLYFTKTDTYDKMDCKGIETVRRDNCTLVVDVISTCLKKLLIDKDPEGAIAYAKHVISDLLQNNVDISQLIISKELSKADYTAKQAHVELAKKMETRDPGTAPQLGDRVPYVIVAAAKNTAAYKKAEDPIYVLENRIPIDVNYYLENQLSKPLLRIFEPVLGDNAESILLRGEHTKTKTLMTSKVSALSAFTRKKETCVGCRSVLPHGEEGGAICQYCQPKEAQLYQQELHTHRNLEQKFSQLYTECQRCQGSLHETVLCTNRDCPIFYVRKKVQMDLETSGKRVERFGEAQFCV